VSTRISAESAGYFLLSVLRGIDNIAKAGVPSSVLEDIARSAMDLLSL
jgi:hypothetical protein